MARKPLAVFDDTHGQPHWSQTGFPSREVHRNFAGVAGVLSDLGCECVRASPQSLFERLSTARLLVLPPPTGNFAAAEEQWQPLAGSLFTPAEVQSILQFLRRGGRLLAFAYRFGDAFTGTNLNALFTPLGCQLSNDVVIDLTRLREVHPLQLEFETPHDVLPLGWSTEGVQTVHWRSLATLTILPHATVQPLVLSPGGRCISFDRVLRRIAFQSLPIAVAGTCENGRFALFGGPHVFETGPLGLLDAAQNRRFLRNVLGWLLDDEDRALHLQVSPPEPDLSTLLPLLAEQWRDVCQVEASGGGEPTIAFVERLLHETGVLRALSRPSWMP